MIAKVKSIPNHSYVTLSGGEPGMIDRSYVLEIMQILTDKSCIVNLNTNGLFLKRYLDIADAFNSIVYHCSEDLDKRIETFKTRCELRYMIVVTDDNFHRLNTFLTYHNDVKFDIVPASYDNETGRPIISPATRYKILSTFSSHMTSESIKRMIHDKDWSIMTFI